MEKLQNSKSGKQKKLKFEEIDLSLYKSSAKCAAFLTSEDGILFWVKTLQKSYFGLLEDNDDYHIKWIDHLNNDDSGFEHIKMKVSRLTAVPDYWHYSPLPLIWRLALLCAKAFHLNCGALREFPRLKEKAEHYNSLYHGATATCDQDLAT